MLCFAKIAGDYFYNSEKPSIVHRRPVEWLSTTIKRDEMSEALRNSTGAIGTISDISKHAEEIEQFIKGESPILISSKDKDIENSSYETDDNEISESLSINSDIELNATFKKFMQIYKSFSIKFKIHTALLITTVFVKN